MHEALGREAAASPLEEAGRSRGPTEAVEQGISASCEFGTEGAWEYPACRTHLHVERKGTVLALLVFGKLMCYIECDANIWSRSFEVARKYDSEGC